MAWSILGTPAEEISNGGGTSIPFTITVPEGTQRVIFFVEYREGGGSGIVQPDGVVVGAEIATFVAYQGGSSRSSNRLECWYLDNPTPGAGLSGSVTFTEVVNDVIIWAACQDGLDLSEAPVAKNSGEDTNTSSLSASITSASWAGSVHFLADCGDGDVYPFGAASGWTTALNTRTGTSQFADISVLVAHRIGADPAGAENFSCSVNGGPTTWMWIEQKVAEDAGGVTGSGALSAGASDASGAGVTGSTGAGDPQADTATASGAGTTGSTGTGALEAGDGGVDGAGDTGSVGTGDLEAGASAVEGTGTVGFIEITGSGDLQAGDSAVSGEGASGSTGTGSLASQAAAAAGAGISGSTGAGDVAAQPSAAEGAGVTGSTGSGALEAQPAIVHGTAENIVTGSGALQAGDAEASGEGLTGSTGSGAVAAGGASADGSGDTGSTGAGALVVAFPAVAGVGASGSTGSGELQATGAVIEGFDIPAVTLGRIAVTQSAATSISVSTRLAAGISTSARALTDLEATESAA